MATTFTTTETGTGVSPRTAHNGVVAVKATYTVAAALVVNDVVQMVKVPKGAQVIDLVLTATDLDTAGPTLVFDVGDGGDTDRYIDGSTIGGTGGTARLGSGITTNTPNHTYADDDTIDVLVQVAPTTGATSGTITLSVLYLSHD